MKKTLSLLVLFLLTIPTLQAAKPKPKPKVDPSQYTIPVHVIGSSIGYAITAIIDGQPVFLAGYSVAKHVAILALGDYKARAIGPSYEPTNHPDYDIYRVYELLLPDGATQQFTLRSIGSNSPADTNSAN